MSTTAVIAIKECKKYRYIRCQTGGDALEVGALLRKYYNTEDKVKELIALGELWWLGTEIGHKINARQWLNQRTLGSEIGQCGAFHRDDDEELIIETVNSIKSIQCLEDYCYVWQDNQWWSYTYYGKKSTIDEAISEAEDKARAYYSKYGGTYKPLVS